MTSKSLNIDIIWFMTGAISACGLGVAIADIMTGAGLTAFTILYLVNFALSTLARGRSIIAVDWKLVAAGGMTSAAVTAGALTQLFAPDVESSVRDWAGYYLLIGVWLLMIDVVYREILLERIRRARDPEAGE
ncbi:hypothetical protein G6L37_06490 [Agrobacterium rubi]|nr:hypothetical protein [Agrobacterium rubi]NTF25011.1 hypothetical protein [Agrobacterium rubi]